MAKAPLRLRINAARQLLLRGSVQKEFIPALSPLDGWPDSSGRLKDYRNRGEQLSANLNWSYAANRAIVDPAAAIELKVYTRDKKGERVEATSSRAADLRELLDSPNNMLTWEQLAQLHYTYMNFNGEGYTLMLRGGEPWTPVPGRLPHAIQELPAYKVQFKLAKSGMYSESTVKYLNREYPITAFIRDINPDPADPIHGQSIIAAAASIINNDQEMREWNNRLMANGATPTLVFNTNEPLTDESYERWKQQFVDEHTGSANAGKPLLIEGGDVKGITLSPDDLQFLETRKFTRDEILAMWRVNPYIIGSVEDVNLATAKAARIQHAEVNTEPRVRQWVRQMNATMVKVYDPTLEIGYEVIVPEDEDAKLKYHTAAVNKWETIDEARAAYGDDELSDDLGKQIYVTNTSAPLSEIAEEGSLRPPQKQPADTSVTDDDGGTNDSDADATRSLDGVKKKTSMLTS